MGLLVSDRNQQPDTEVAVKEQKRATVWKSQLTSNIRKKEHEKTVVPETDKVWSKIELDTGRVARVY